MQANPTIKGKWIITTGAFISMSFLGMSRTFLGTALPAIRTSLDLNLIQAGTLTAFLQFGFALAVFVGGPLSDVFKKTTLLMLGCVLMALNLILFGLSHWFWLNVIGMGLVGIGGGLIESSSNPLLIQLFPGRESMVMNLHHFFFAAGSLTGPLIVGAILAESIPWQWAYIGFGLFVLLIFILFLSKRVSSSKGGKGVEFKAIGKLIQQRTLLALFFVAFCSNGVQNGIGYWVVTLLRETRGFSIALASASLSLFFACLAAGRLFSSYVITKLEDAAFLLGLFFLVFVFLLISVLVPGKWAVPFFALCGLSFSGIFPCLLALGGKLFQEKPGSAMGLIATGAGLGAMVVPWLMSAVAQAFNLQVGFLFFEIPVLTCLTLIAANFRRLKASGKSSLLI